MYHDVICIMMSWNDVFDEVLALCAESAGYGGFLAQGVSNVELSWFLFVLASINIWTHGRVVGKFLNVNVTSP